ncbi:glycoside hydrolase family protein [Sphingomonas sp. 28-63-12]|uniref:glycoside hydrolase family protein n=1 Tax=Sphingomonas sp. 28-63-12 TaxID=1970434 RepID=UPI000BCC41A2|nr:MAG: hypothetical protein B7Y47_02030 [Sphingomonas sp. 28-63-12]
MTEASEKAIKMIVAFEVTSESTYTSKYQSTIWPGGQSGVTIGIGYDLGYTTNDKLQADWGDKLPAAMIAELKQAVGVTGTAAKEMAAHLAPQVLVPWDAANAVFRERDVPNYSAMVRKALANTGLLSGDSFGALLSLTFNRGPSFKAVGDRYREMNAIRDLMAAKNFAAIPAQFMAMQRLWPTVAGLRARREKESKLFAGGLV